MDQPLFAVCMPWRSSGIHSQQAAAQLPLLSCLLTICRTCISFHSLFQVGSWSRVLEDAVRSLINDHGVTVVVASGNSGVDACYVAPGEGWWERGWDGRLLL